MFLRCPNCILFILWLLLFPSLDSARHLPVSLFGGLCRNYICGEWEVKMLHLFSVAVTWIHIQWLPYLFFLSSCSDEAACSNLIIKCIWLCLFLSLVSSVCAVGGCDCRCCSLHGSEGLQQASGKKAFVLYQCKLDSSPGVLAGYAAVLLWSH